MKSAGLDFANPKANHVEVYDLQNAKAAPKMIGGFVEAIENLNITPDGTAFYARDNSGHSIRISDFNTSKEVVQSKEKIYAIDLNPDGTKLAGVTEDGNLIVWDLQNNYQPSVTKILA